MITPNPNTEHEKQIVELVLELKILTRAYNELFKLHYGYEPGAKEVIAHVPPHHG